MKRSHIAIVVGVVTPVLLLNLAVVKPSDSKPAPVVHTHMTVLQDPKPANMRVIQPKPKPPAPKPKPPKPKPPAPKPEPTVPEPTVPKTITPEKVWTRVSFYNVHRAEAPEAQNIAYPGLHRVATSGRGTYEDPITFASTLRAFYRGQRIYIPRIHKYAIMEDLCGTARDVFPSMWVDLFVGYSSHGDAIDSYAYAMTLGGKEWIVVHPLKTYPVDEHLLWSNETGGYFKTYKAYD